MNRLMEIARGLLVVVLSSGVAVVCLQCIVYVSTQLSTVDAHAGRLTKLEDSLVKSNEQTAQAFKDLEADRRAVRERMLQDLSLIKAKLGINQ